MSKHVFYLTVESPVDRDKTKELIQSILEVGISDACQTVEECDDEDNEDASIIASNEFEVNLE